ncbi:hypothetical protein J437_LFUL010305 [Ladona fulva]|uniref:Uncharacterized protein n=1 Tax=Ladona fulva TaxID=123851 RepID=A0A8K0P6J8_LADFU|nr:hypothetical protein J437_LFUL010305 [Ladona fulva]
MPRNSSVRSSFSCKTENCRHLATLQEDFRDEIMDLKRQLACMKEESKLLKVKLRRSEENAARKEKIICTMIDPMKV